MATVTRCRSAGCGHDRVNGLTAETRAPVGPVRVIPQRTDQLEGLAAVVDRNRADGWVRRRSRRARRPARAGSARPARRCCPDPRGTGRLRPATRSRSDQDRRSGRPRAPVLTGAADEHPRLIPGCRCRCRRCPASGTPVRTSPTLRVASDRPIHRPFFVPTSSTASVIVASDLRHPPMSFHPRHAGDERWVTRSLRTCVRAHRWRQSKVTSRSPPGSRGRRSARRPLGLWDPRARGVERAEPDLGALAETDTEGEGSR